MENISDRGATSQLSYFVPPIFLYLNVKDYENYDREVKAKATSNSLATPRTRRRASSAQTPLAYGLIQEPVEEHVQPKLH